MQTTIHAHIWIDGIKGPIEIDATPSTLYDMSTEEEKDDLAHWQFCAELPNKQHLEIRLPLEWLTEEAKALFMAS